VCVGASRTSRRLVPGPGIQAPDGSGRERVAEIQRARMQYAMVHMASERGAANVTVADIVARSSVSRRTFYEAFEDRQDCFLATFEEAVDRAASVVIDAYERAGSWQARVRAALISLLDLFDRERELGRLLVVESLAAGTRVLEHRQRVLTQIIATVHEGGMGVKRGEGPPPLTAEGVVGGVLSVLYSRLVQDTDSSLLDLTGALTGMVVLPYLGGGVARHELQRPVPQPSRNPQAGERGNALLDLQMRLTYRTVRVLGAIAAYPGASNRQIGVAAGIDDQGQISKLLARLKRLELIDNTQAQAGKGTANAWTLTPKGVQVHETLATQTNGNTTPGTRSHA
jgi:AcrR family transcriptional regulator